MQEPHEFLPQYRRPARPGVDMAARRAAAQREQQEKGKLFGRIPKSIAINFAALLALFAIVYGLQTFGEKFKAKPVQEQPTAKSISVAAMPAQSPPVDEAVQEAKAAAPEQQPLPAEVRTVQPAPSQKPTVPSAVYTLPQKQPEAKVAGDDEVAPRIDQNKTAVAKKNAVAAAKQRGGSYDDDRSFSVDQLDNETARRNYAAQNHGVAYNPPAPYNPPIKETTLPKYAPPVAAPKQVSRTPDAASQTLHQAVYDLDDDEARQAYLAKNRGASDATLDKRIDKKNSQTKPVKQPSEDDFIPYEQPR